MDRRSLVWLWALVFVQCHLYVSLGCLEKERIALLEIKASLNNPNGSSLPSWEDRSDCCSWERLKCNNKTQRVTEISLSRISKFRLEDRYLNADLFLSFEELQGLDLSYNYLHGWVDNEGFGRWSRLRKLENLDLSENHFNQSILPYLGALSSLRSLSLAGNLIESSHIGFEMLPRLSKLEHLDLYGNLFSKTILPYLGALSSLKSLDLSFNKFEGWFHIEELANLSKLEVLDLENNELTGFVAPLAESLTSLQALSLSSNRLNRSLTLEGLCKLRNLQELDVSDNELEESLPPCLGNLSSLRFLDLSRNRLEGFISSSLIANLTMLEYISLSYNRFEGSFSFSSLANLSKLEVVELLVLKNPKFGKEFITYPNQLVIGTESPSWAPTFQLKVLHLSNCNINKPTGIIPNFLSSQNDLRSLDLSHNNMEGKFPSWLLENNQRLEVLNLRSNSFVGSFHLPPQPGNLHAFWFDMSNNHIHGQIPQNIALLLPNLEYLNMSTNALDGTIPPSVGDMKQLISLDLSRNNFSGEIPEQLATGCISLQILKLSNNALHGLAFPKHSNLTQLTYLSLENNRFTGKISPGLFKSLQLCKLDISENYISGSLPSHIGNFSDLLTLVMSKNHFEGPIPVEYCKLSVLDLLDLSHNNIVGSIPSCFDQTALRFMHLQGNGFTGSMPNALSNISSIVTLDIRYNNISGSIPDWIGVLPNLRVLLLKGNHLQGHIPIHLCQLNNISIIDLSKNNLSGEIPSCLGNMMLGSQEVIDSSFFRQYYYSGMSMNRSTYMPKRRIHVYPPLDVYDDSLEEQEEVEFITKSRSETYKGDILYFMSGIDLSWNQLTGEIPPEVGNLSRIHALNLSNNQLTGEIPETFCHLKQIESLDLSYNQLNGKIPSQLTELNFLSTFSVAHNNLSGRIPDRKAQFGTFKETSYEGNPLLCGPPLKSCYSTSLLPPSAPTTSDDEEKDFDINFYACFLASYVVWFLVSVAVLYLNRYWREVFFGFVDRCIYSCYYFALDNLCKAIAHVTK